MGFLFVACFLPLFIICFVFFALFDPPNTQSIKKCHFKSEEDKPVLHTLCAPPPPPLPSHITLNVLTLALLFFFFIWQALSSRILQGLSYNTRRKISSTLQTVLLMTFFFPPFPAFPYIPKISSSFDTIIIIIIMECNLLEKREQSF